MADRDAQGRFVPGNKVCQFGWRALVGKRFGGDEEAARCWISRVGAHTYARMALEGTVLEHRLVHWPYPGTPEQFLAVQYSQDVNFYAKRAVA